MQGRLFDDGLGLKSVYLWCFYGFPLFSRFSLILMICKLDNCISGHEMKSIYLTFNLVPSLVVYDK